MNTVITVSSIITIALILQLSSLSLTNAQGQILFSCPKGYQYNSLGLCAPLQPPQPLQQQPQVPPVQQQQPFVQPQPQLTIPSPPLSLQIPFVPLPTNPLTSPPYSIPYYSPLTQSEEQEQRERAILIEQQNWSSL